MDYKKIYENLIQSAKEYPKDEKYKENHHIIPVCMGGTNDKSNLIKLTARQHFLAHWLLYKIYKNSKLVHAWNNMSMISEGQSPRKLNSHLFKYIKVNRAQELSVENAGENNPFYGKKHTDDTRTIISIAQKVAWSNKSQDELDKHSERISKRHKGVPKSEEHRKKIGRKGLMTITNIQTSEIKRIAVVDKILYDSNIWKNTRTLASLINWKCEHCNKEGVGSGNYVRWHGDKCKLKGK